MNRHIVFLIQCDDKKGLLSEITSFFYDCGFNILHCLQHSDLFRKKYFMRIELDLSDLKTSRKEFEASFKDFAENLRLQWSVHFSDYIPKMAIFVSKTSHCLYDLILRHKEEELKCEIPLILSNHPDLEYVAEQFRIPFYCLPVNKENKKQQEKEVLKLLKKHHVDFVVLARYMQILSEDFIEKYPEAIINIHHAFLPAFEGANPYQRAYERGVKMIGATAHYATKDLDRGPIIEQDVERVTHEATPDDLKTVGRDIERKVLSKAVKLHLEHRIMVSNHRTIVFSSGY
jgi:formyltetrahydrofolate deformylase